MHACVSLGIIRNHKNRFHKDTWVVPASPAAAATGVQMCVEGGVTACGRGPCARSAAPCLGGEFTDSTGTAAPSGAPAAVWLCSIQQAFGGTVPCGVL